MPAFDIEGGLLLTLARRLSVAALLSVFGVLLFRTVVAPAVLPRMPDDRLFLRRWRLLLWSSWCAAILATLVWLALQAASMADADGLAAAASAIPAVLMDTSFGHVLLLRLAILALLASMLGPNRRQLWLAMGLAALATALQAGHSHAASMQSGPSLLLLSAAVHLLAAGAWLGGLATFLALLKLALFAVLLGLACNNRFRLTPALANIAEAKRGLLRSIGVETGVGLIAVLAAGLLTSLPPAVHLQPVWPLAQRLSLDAVRDDADFRMEVLQGAFALAGAAALIVAACFTRRLRWPAVALAAIIAGFALPHFDLLLAEAYPTSFYRSPTEFAASAIVDGARLYPEHCASCHGTDGYGDGPAAAGLRIPPADLTAGHLWMHADGELFWWLSHGIDAPDGGQAMPGFAAALSDDERWSLIDYIRAHNAGVTMAGMGAWSPPVQAPELQAACGGQMLALHDLRGRFVRLIIGEPSATATIANVGAENPIGCVIADGSVPSAYAIIAGIPLANLTGAQFLIDGQGWLRAVQPPGDSLSWSDPQSLAAEIRALAAHPIDAAPGSSDHMNMPM